jgi:CDP-4-dehydro-6-deoxyglucose reductase/ferredoxin-NAD(P)+ reductase (naphthalene dioxygenase ferredoxin-specific)
MTYTIKIRQFDEPVVADIGQTILEAALKQGLDYPCGCRSGNCGACKSTLFSGEVEMSPYSEFALTEEEKAGGLILACRAVPWSDCEVAYLEPDEVAVHLQRKLVCSVIGLEDATHDIKIVRLRVDRGGPFGFSAGQYAQVTFPGQPPRDYSMANRPDEEVLEFHIRHVGGGRVSKFVAETLALGDTVEVEGPYGIAQLRENHTGPIVALAGGSGLAPVMSIIETALAKGMGQDMHLYFGVRDERDIYLEDHFRLLAANHPNLNFVPVLSEPSGSTSRRIGFLADVVRADFADLDGAKAYLAGPPVMVETCVAALEQLGVGRENCHADAFYTEAEKIALEAS